MNFFLKKGDFTSLEIHDHTVLYILRLLFFEPTSCEIANAIIAIIWWKFQMCFSKIWLQAFKEAFPLSILKPRVYILVFLFVGVKIFFPKEKSQL